MKVEQNNDGLLVEYGRPHYYMSAGSVDGDYFTHYYVTLDGRNMRITSDGDWAFGHDVFYPSIALSKRHYLEEIRYSYWKPIAAGAAVSMRWSLMRDDKLFFVSLGGINLSSFPPGGLHVHLSPSNIIIRNVNIYLKNNPDHKWYFGVNVNSFAPGPVDFGDAFLTFYAKIGHRK